MASEVAGDDAGGKVGGVGAGVGDAEVGKDGTQDDANATKAMSRRVDAFQLPSEHELHEETE